MSSPEFSPVPDEARAFQGASAGIASRLVASAIDGLIVAAMTGGCYLAWVGLLFLLEPLSFRWPPTNWLLGLSLALWLATVYLAIGWWLVGGRTYGAHVMGLRVIDRRGRHLGFARSALRAGFCVFFPIGLFWCVVSPKRYSVQDLALWTRVVYDWAPNATVTPPEIALGGAVVESIVISEGSAAGIAHPDGERVPEGGVPAPPAARRARRLPTGRRYTKGPRANRSPAGDPGSDAGRSGDPGGAGPSQP